MAQLGRIRDAQGRPFTPTHTQKDKVRYRYYVGMAAKPSAKDVVAPTLRIPAARIEAVVVGSLRGLILAEDQPSDDAALVAAHLEAVVVHRDRLVLQLEGAREPHTIPWSYQPYHPRREILVPPGREGEQLRPMKREDRDRILRAIARGRTWMRGLVSGRILSPAAIGAREKLTERSVRMTLSLAHLAPSIVKAIVEARLPRGIGLRHLTELPPSWAEQERILGM